jgi:hypothetical protein
LETNLLLARCIIGALYLIRYDVPKLQNVALPLIHWEAGELVEIVQLLPNMKHLILVARQSTVLGNATAELSFVPLSGDERATIPITDEEFVNMCENPSEDVMENIANDLSVAG